MLYQPREEERQRQPRPYQREAVAEINGRLNPERPQMLHAGTGGGKTWIANDVIGPRAVARQPVLYLAPRQLLIEQAQRDLAERYPESRRCQRRLGKATGRLAALPRGLSPNGVTYATTQAVWAALRRGRLEGYHPSLVAIDEAHWGETGVMMLDLLDWAAARGVPVLGLSATPRGPGCSWFEVAYSKSFHDLVDEGWLARPIPRHAVNTGVRWDPTRSAEHLDFDAGSLATLARSQRRNIAIVDYYRLHASEFGKTLVFACNKDHAERLAQLFFERAGVGARAIHSGRGDAANHQALADFRTGRISVLVSVDMLVMGLDVPDARSVFLCRPTTSEVRFSQMVGRGARLAPGKRSFHLVEFVDLLVNFGDQLMTSKRAFSGYETPSTSSGRRRPGRHHFEATSGAAWVPDILGIHPALRGLWYRHQQTFGVEIELTGEGMQDLGVWMSKAEALRRGLVDALGAGKVAAQPYSFYASGCKDSSVWNIDLDSSAGWEVSSRVLCGEEGLEEAAVACDVISRVAKTVGLRVNADCGLHVHLGWNGVPIGQIAKAIKLFKSFEPGMASLVAPSRIAEFDGAEYDPTRPNRYCRPLCTVFDREHTELLQFLPDIEEMLDAMDREAEPARYVSFNLCPLSDLGTVEVRLHSGTCDAHKVLLWISLCQQILWAAQYGPKVEGPANVETIEPNACIIELARRYLPPDPQGVFSSRLHTRRLEVKRIWDENETLRHWSRYAACWIDPDAEVETDPSDDDASIDLGLKLCEQAVRTARARNALASPPTP